MIGSAKHCDISLVVIVDEQKPSPPGMARALWMMRCLWIFTISMATFAFLIVVVSHQRSSDALSQAAPGIAGYCLWQVFDRLAAGSKHVHHGYQHQLLLHHGRCQPQSGWRHEDIPVRSKENIFLCAMASYIATRVFKRGCFAVKTRSESWKLTAAGGIGVPVKWWCRCTFWFSPFPKHLYQALSGAELAETCGNLPNQKGFFMISVFFVRFSLVEWKHKAVLNFTSVLLLRVFMCCHLLPTKKSPRHWSFINTSGGESLTVWSEKWDAEWALIWQPKVQQKKSCQALKSQYSRRRVLRTSFWTSPFVTTRFPGKNGRFEGLKKAGSKYQVWGSKYILRPQDSRGPKYEVEEIFEKPMKF